MAIEIEAYTLIDQYLLGELSEADKHRFEQRIKTDLDLDKEYELQKDLMGLMELQEQLI